MLHLCCSRRQAPTPHLLVRNGRGRRPERLSHILALAELPAVAVADHKDVAGDLHASMVSHAPCLAAMPAASCTFHLMELAARGLSSVIALHRLQTGSSRPGHAHALNQRSGAHTRQTFEWEKCSTGRFTSSSGTVASRCRLGASTGAASPPTAAAARFLERLGGSAGALSAASEGTSLARSRCLVVRLGGTEASVAVDALLLRRRAADCARTGRGTKGLERCQQMLLHTAGLMAGYAKGYLC